MNAIKNNRSLEFIKEFGLATIIDYFVYEIIIISTKTLVYYFIIKSDKFPWWKKFLVSVISTLPWVLTYL
jgi:hypothetical protein